LNEPATSPSPPPSPESAPTNLIPDNKVDEWHH
jgi:hypothetical protein